MHMHSDTLLMADDTDLYLVYNLSFYPVAATVLNSILSISMYCTFTSDWSYLAVLIAHVQQTSVYTCDEYTCTGSLCSH